jgi:DnaJ-class molecular chaperone
MKCWHCDTELIWGGDDDLEDDEDFVMVTNLSCPTCNSFVLVSLPHQPKPDTGTHTCPTCKGEGRVKEERTKLGEQASDRFAPPIYYPSERECEDCGGVGHTNPGTDCAI